MIKNQSACCTTERDRPGIGAGQFERRAGVDCGRLLLAGELENRFLRSLREPGRRLELRGRLVIVGMGLGAPTAIGVKAIYTFAFGAFGTN